MSEYLNNAEKRRNDLMAFSMGMMNGDDGKVLIEKYKEAIENVTPQDMLKIEDKQMQMGITPDQIKGDIEKIINVFVQSLNRYPWEKPAEGSFLFYLMLENDAFTFKLNQVKRIIKNYKGREESEFKKLKSDLLPHFKKFQEFDFHYIKKENILFPYLEACWESYRPLKVMWSLHDDIRKSLKELIAMLESDISEWQKFNKQLGKYFSLVFRMIQKENSIIFPVATETVKAET
ncbi:MAG: hemerythrin domain-containing protein [Bacteroidales bacterium]|nr:hemerythrin domain-containing protein [Bacteroidales bacterium]